MRFSALIELLRCPNCRGELRFAATATPTLGAAEFGTLTCACGRYPVLDGIPILLRDRIDSLEHTTNDVEIAGPSVADLLRMLDRGRAMDALVEALIVPHLPAIARRLPWRIAHGAALSHVAKARGRRRLYADVLKRRSALSLREALNYFYHPDGPLDADVKHYFALRFGQPRHLAVLALLAALPSGAAPVLDLACGIGHLAHYLTGRPRSVPVIGLDVNLFHLWLARHWTCPQAHVVCANAAMALPFADAAFSAITCSDAYHYIPNRTQLVSEFRRVAPGMPYVLSRVGNRAVMPNEGDERTVEQYAQELGGTVSVFSEQALRRCYLQRANPFAMDPEAGDALQAAKWLSFVVNPPVAHDDLGGEPWPHAVGQLCINPIFVPSRQANGDVRLRFDFPTKWYAYENHDMLSYHPRSARVTAEQLARLHQPGGATALPSLVEQFVVIGAPSRF